LYSNNFGDWYTLSGITVFKGQEFDRKEDKKVISVDEIGERYGKIAFAA